MNACCLFSTDTHTRQAFRYEVGSYTLFYF